MAFSEYLAAFFDDFTVDCTVAGSSIKAIFDHQYVEVSIGQAPYSGLYPTLTADANDLVLDAAVVIGTDNYKIIDIRPDGTGIAMAVMVEI